jgi:hypothetical protein
MEYYCHYCLDWLDSAYCESHFEGIHNQPGVTFEKLKERMSILGGLETREEPAPEPEATETPKRKNWLFRDKDDNYKNGVFITNNFQHNLK